MRVFKLSFKNLFINWQRSFTLGSFIFLGSMLLVVLGCLSSTVTSNMQDAIRNSTSGDIQIRATGSNEEDIDRKSVV